MWGSLRLAPITTFLSNNLPAAESHVGMSKKELKQLLSIVNGEKERECIKYTLYKASSISPTQARCLFGLEYMKARALEVEASVGGAEEIGKAYDDLAYSQDQAILDCYGLSASDLENPQIVYSSEESSDSDHMELVESEDKTNTPDEKLLISLQNSNYNWFEFSDHCNECGIENSRLENFFIHLSKMEQLNCQDLVP